MGGEGIKAENNGAARLCGHSMCSACAGELCNYVVCVFVSTCGRGKVPTYDDAPPPVVKLRLGI